MQAAVGEKFDWQVETIPRAELKFALTMNGALFVI